MFVVVKSRNFGTGMMVERLKHEGTSHNSSDLLKVCVKMRAKWSAQVFRQADDTPSGPFISCSF